MADFIEVVADDTPVLQPQQVYDGSWKAPWGSDVKGVLVDDTPNPLTQANLDLSWRMPVPSFFSQLVLEYEVAKPSTHTNIF